MIGAILNARNSQRGPDRKHSVASGVRGVSHERAEERSRRNDRGKILPARDKESEWREEKRRENGGQFARVCVRRGGGIYLSSPPPSLRRRKEPTARPRETLERPKVEKTSGAARVYLGQGYKVTCGKDAYVLLWLVLSPASSLVL